MVAKLAPPLDGVGVGIAAALGVEDASAVGIAEDAQPFSDAVIAAVSSSIVTRPSRFRSSVVQRASGNSSSAIPTPTISSSIVTPPLPSQSPGHGDATRGAVAVAGGPGVAVGGAATVADGVAVSGGPCTVTETVPRLESVDPSHAANVNESAPANPTSGTYRTFVPSTTAVPWAGGDTIRRVRALPSGSAASRAIATATFSLVVAVPSLTTAARFGLRSSLWGPRWHV